LQKQRVLEREQIKMESEVNSAAMPTDVDAVNAVSPSPKEALAQAERLAYSIEESAQLLGVHYFSVYRLVQRGKLRACRVLRGKLLIPRSELLKLLKTE
jgi:excisionase family DNA binding protein